ncbi:MAG: heme o synthase [Myxococcales bacterium]|nr:heme o synthase [Myxococcales bacterium]
MSQANPAKSAVAASTPATSIRAVLPELWALTKPGIVTMCLVTTAAGLWLASMLRPEMALGALKVIAALFGTAAAVGAANALNMYLERDGDRLMQRTRTRPLPAGRLHPRVALVFGLALGAVALVVLAALVNPLSALLAALALDTYVLLYTPLKRRTWLAVFVGAVPGAMPPLIGWTAVTASVDAPGMALLLVLVLWQLPHFFAIALYRAAEYKKAGIKVLPNERNADAARLQSIFYSALLLPASLVLVPYGVAGAAYLVVAGLAGALMLGGATYDLRAVRGNRGARRFFLVTLLYLPLLTIALVLDAIVR